MGNVLVESLDKWVKETRDIKMAHPIDISVDVKSVIPHRGEMLLIDELSQITENKDVLRARTLIDKNDPIFRGHFPSDPVYPGVLLVEVISQTGVCLVKLSACDDVRQIGNSDTLVRAIKLLYAEFISEIKPGDSLDIEVKAFDVTPFLSVFGGRIMRDNEVCAIAIVEVYVGE